MMRLQKMKNDFFLDEEAVDIHLRNIKNRMEGIKTELIKLKSLHRNDEKGSLEDHQLVPLSSNLITDHPSELTFKSRPTKWPEPKTYFNEKFANVYHQRNLQRN
jgi:hypothetical protein